MILFNVVKIYTLGIAKLTHNLRLMYLYLPLGASMHGLEHSEIGASMIAAVKDPFWVSQEGNSTVK